MPAPSPWVICLPRPDGQQDCQDIPVLLWPNEGFADPLPDVTGLFYIAGWNTLHDLGYDVIQKTFVTGAEDLDGIIGDQEPAGGTPQVAIENASRTIMPEE